MPHALPLALAVKDKAKKVADDHVDGAKANKLSASELRLQKGEFCKGCTHGQ